MQIMSEILMFLLGAVVMFVLTEMSLSSEVVKLRCFEAAIDRILNASYREIPDPVLRRIKDMCRDHGCYSEWGDTDD